MIGIPTEGQSLTGDFSDASQFLLGVVEKIGSLRVAEDLLLSQVEQVHHG